MAPIKFEDKLKERLESRTLEPSSEAWKALSDRLDQTEKKNNRTIFWWLSIAASVISVIFVSTQFFKTETVKEVPVVLEIKGNQNHIEPIIESVNSNSVVSNNEEQKENNEMATTSRITSKVDTQVKDTKKVRVQLKPQKEAVASNEKSEDEVTPLKVLTMEELKIIEVMSEIERLQASQTSVTEQEIDALLKQAQREILKQRLSDESALAINADLLLQDVEVELEQSFRAKVFEALKSSYNSVKTAVAERRN